ncbi:MAG: hypothetical protein IE933_12740 [Sphingomonadales bacterium]|nr:hypothetical protein [Sphingomonadales bacterium]MBD3772167.1 hypothetical protein [Paracoccaceae bacterium]MBD3814266.1 hypothetical protein [Betaproteobacteria bacterium]
MNRIDSMQLIYLVAWLALMATAFMSFRLSWKSGIKYALIWAAIFAGVGFAFVAFTGQ